MDNVESLQRLGFTEYEARAYLALLENNPATAYEVSKLSGLPRPNVYGAVESLAKKGAVQPVSRKPVRYVPVDPEELLGRIAADTTTRCRDLATHLARPAQGDGTEYVWTLTGENTIALKVADMIMSARRHIWIKSAVHRLEPHRDHLKEAAERGVKILAILFGEKKEADRFRFGPGSKIYLHEASGVVIALGTHMVTLTTDFEEALVANTAEGGYGAHTRSRPIVELTDNLIRHEVYLAEIIERFEPEITSAFGPALLSLREKYLRPEQIRALRERLGLHGQGPSESGRGRVKQEAE